MADDELIGQDEIEKLLGGGGGGGDADAAANPPADDSIDQSEIEALLGGGGGAAAAPEPAAAPSPDVDDDKLLSQEDIEAMLGGGGGGGSSAGSGSAPVSNPVGDMRSGDETTMVGEGDISQGDVEFLLNQAEEALNSVVTDQDELPANVLEFQLPEFGGAVPSVDNTTLDLISEIELDVKIELGRAEMYLDDVLKLRKGSVVPLDKLAGDPVDIYVNNRLVARGEVLVMNDNFCVRVAELVAGSAPVE